MKYGILGPLEIRSDGGDVVAIRQGLHRKVLAVLLLHAGQQCSREMLAAAIWGDKPPGDKALTTAIYGIRQVTAGAVSPRAVTAGYILDVKAGELDLHRWRYLVVHGQQALDSRDCAAAERILTAALEQWRSPPLADLPATAAVEGEKARLLSDRRGAEDALLDAKLALGKHEEVLPDLRAIVSGDPLREHSWAQLMVALFRCGQRLAALAAYTKVQAELRDAYGVEPSPELQDLAGQIRASDPAHLTSPTARWEPVCQLPAAVADFTDRENDSRALTEMLDPALNEGMPVAVVSGPPGCGKTSLAVHTAHSLRQVFPDGQLYLELAGASGRPRDPGAVLSEILRALGVPPGDIPETLPERAALYRSRIAGRRLLVVADDAHSPRQVRSLLPGTAGCATLITSRGRMTAVAGAHSLRLGVLPAAAAVSLLGKIIGPERAAGDQPSARSIVASCGYLPLAVRIAGAKLASRPAMPLAALAKSLASERQCLDELSLGPDLEVRASVALSYGALDPRSQRAFRLLSLASCHFSPWQLAALLGEPGSADVLDTLADKCLLDAEPAVLPAQPRYRMHDLLRQYAAERMAADPREDAARASGRLARGWLELADLADRGFPGEAYFLPAQRVKAREVVPEDVARELTADPVAWFAAEHSSLIAAAEQMVDACDYTRAAQLAHYQAAYQCAQGRLDEAARLWRKIATAARAAGDTAAAADAEYSLAVVMALSAGEAAGPAIIEAMTMAERCLHAFEAAGDCRAQARAHCLRAYCAEAAGGMLPTALAAAERGLDLAVTTGDHHAEFLSRRILAKSYARLEMHDLGIACCTQALAVARMLREPRCETSALLTLASVHILAGQEHAVAEVCRLGLAITRGRGLGLDEARFHYRAGVACHRMGRHTDAIGELQSALVILSASDARLYRARCLRALADCYTAVGDDRNAVTCLEEAMRAFDGTGELRREWDQPHGLPRAPRAPVAATGARAAAPGATGRPGGPLPPAPATPGTNGTHRE